MGQVSLTQSTVAGCDSTISHAVTVIPTPNPVIAGNDSACAHKVETYQVNSPVAGHTYLWNVTGGTILTANNGSSIQVKWGTMGSGNVTLRQTSPFGCDSIVSMSVVILVTPTPVISGEDSTCSNKFYTYRIVPVAGHVYQWNVSGGNIIGSSQADSVSVQWASAGC